MSKLILSDVINKTCLISEEMEYDIAKGIIDNFYKMYNQNTTLYKIKLENDKLYIIDTSKFPVLKFYVQI